MEGVSVESEYITLDDKFFMFNLCRRLHIKMEIKELIELLVFMLNFYVYFETYSSAQSNVGPCSSFLCPAKFNSTERKRESEREKIISVIVAIVFVKL